MSSLKAIKEEEVIEEEEEEEIEEEEEEIEEEEEEWLIEEVEVEEEEEEVEEEEVEEEVEVKEEEVEEEEVEVKEEEVEEEEEPEEEEEEEEPEEEDDPEEEEEDPEEEEEKEEPHQVEEVQQQVGASLEEETKSTHEEEEIQVRSASVSPPLLLSVNNLQILNSAISDFLREWNGLQQSFVSIQALINANISRPEERRSPEKMDQSSKQIHDIDNTPKEKELRPSEQINDAPKEKEPRPSEQIDDVVKLLSLEQMDDEDKERRPLEQIDDAPKDKKHQSSSEQMNEIPKKKEQIVPPKERKSEQMDDAPKDKKRPSEQMDETPKDKKRPSEQMDETPKDKKRPSEQMDEAPKDKKRPSEQMDEAPKDKKRPSEQMDETLKDKKRPSEQMDEAPKDKKRPSEQMDEAPKDKKRPSEQMDEAPKDKKRPSEQMDETLKDKKRPSEHMDDAPKNKKRPSEKMDESPKDKKRPSEQMDETPKNKKRPSEQMDESPKDKKRPSEQMDGAPKKERKSELESICRSMDSRSLRRYVVSNLSDINGLRKEVPAALGCAPNPAKLVFDSITRFYLDKSSVYDNPKSPNPTMIAGRRASILLLELYILSGCCSLQPTIEVEARAAASAWMARIVAHGGFQSVTAMDALGLILFVASFGIPSGLHAVALYNLFRSSQPLNKLDVLRLSPYLLDKIPGVIKEMITKDMLVEAVDLVCAFGMEEKFDPLPLLSSFCHRSMQKKEADERKVDSLRSVVRCMEEHKLKLSGFNIYEKIAKLEKEGAKNENGKRMGDEDVGGPKKAQVKQHRPWSSPSSSSTHHHHPPHHLIMQQQAQAADFSGSAYYNGGLLVGGGGYNNMYQPRFSAPPDNLYSFADTVLQHESTSQQHTFTNPPPAYY